jgi:LmbE family N-acetylglucosaminyl deacetylase
MADLFDDVPARVLAVYAHPDDADVACAGTLARWARAGSEVHLVVCTDGARGTSDPDTDTDTLALERGDEVAAASALVGVASAENLGFGDGDLENDVRFRALLVERIRRHRPDLVMGHDPTAVFFGEHYFNHRDHRSAGWALLDAVSPAAGLPHYFPAAGSAHQVPLVFLSGTLEPDVWVQVDETIDVKVAAVDCHKSQFAHRGGWASEAIRLRAADEGRGAGVAYAESFRRLRMAE